MRTESKPSQLLSSCPFCGGEACLVTFEDENVPELEPIYFVACRECGANGSHRDTPFQAEDWWNGKYLQVAIQDRLEDGC